MENKKNRVSKLALISLISGILAFYLGPLGILAIILGSIAKRKIKNSQESLRGRKSASAGMILGIIVLVIWSPLNHLADHYGYYNWRTFKVYRMVTSSMDLGVLRGDRVVVYKKAYVFTTPKRGNIIAFRFPNKKRTFIKRVVGLENETVEIKNGKVLINNKEVDNPVIKNIYYPNRGNYGKENTPIIVPEGHLYVLGNSDDNKRSKDSRDWGFIPLENVIGKAVCIYWPPKRIGRVK